MAIIATVTLGVTELVMAVVMAVVVTVAMAVVAAAETNVALLSVTKAVNRDVQSVFPTPLLVNLAD